MIYLMSLVLKEMSDKSLKGLDNRGYFRTKVMFSTVTYPYDEFPQINSIVQ